MTMKRSVTVTGITYTELLATVPWIAVLAATFRLSCEYLPMHNRKPCKTAATLMYVDLDGSIHHYCHNHVYPARMEGVGPEAARNRKWCERATITNWMPSP